MDIICTKLLFCKLFFFVLGIECTFQFELWQLLIITFFSWRKCARTGHFRNVLITFPDQNMYIAPQFPYHMISIELLYVHMLVGLTLMLFVQKCQLGLAKNISSLKLKQNFHFALETRNGTRFVILRRCNFTRKKKKIRC